jgi:hypothetical protein
MTFPADPDFTEGRSEGSLACGALFSLIQISGGAQYCARLFGPRMVCTRCGIIGARNPDYKGKGLQLEFTVEDAGVFTTPWSATITYRRPLGEWPEFVCADNRRHYPFGALRKRCWRPPTR